MILETSAALAIFVIALAVAAQIYARRKTLREFQSQELTPNILLTRYPLVFVSRPKGLFRLFGDFKETPQILREHGFDVRVLASRSPRAEIAKLDRPYHLFFHRENRQVTELFELSGNGPSVFPQAKSFQALPSTSWPLVLERAVLLAESDCRNEPSVIP